MPDPSTARCLSWLSHLGIYQSDHWSTDRPSLTTEYFSFASAYEMSDFHLKEIPAWTTPEFFSVPDPLMLNLIHFDVIRLSRLFSYFPPHGPELLRRMERVLYILGSVCRPTKYIQGFNELLGPLYLVILRARNFFANDDEIEAMAFHSLHSLLTQTRLSDLFTTEDGSSVLLHRLSQFERMVERHLPEVAVVINKFRIHPMCYCFRWFSLLFAQDHPLEEVLALWDEAFARIDWIVEFSMYVGLGHLKQMEQNFVGASHSGVMRVLQNARACDLDMAMNTGTQFWQSDTQKRTTSKRWATTLISYAMSIWSYII
jgi:hypothetical protein